MPPPGPRRASVTRRKLTFLASFAAYFGVLWVFWDTSLVYPLKVFVVLLHEISHGVMAIATGGSIDRITLSAQQGGACYCPGGSPFLMLSAGYLGSLAWGVVMVLLAQSRRVRSQHVITGVGVMVVALTLGFVRSGFGIAYGVAFGAALVVIGVKLGAGFNRMLLRVLGLTSCLYAILDIKSDILDRPGLRSDAAMLAELTRIPTLVWGVLWIVIAIVVSGLLFRAVFRKA
jgi:hypothetical protein